MAGQFLLLAWGSICLWPRPLVLRPRPLDLPVLWAVARMLTCVSFHDLVRLGFRFHFFPQACAQLERLHRSTAVPLGYGFNLKTDPLQEVHDPFESHLYCISRKQMRRNPRSSATQVCSDDSHFILHEHRR